MSYRNHQNAETGSGVRQNWLVESEDRHAIDQAIDHVYAVALIETGPEAFLSALAAIVDADAVLLEGPTHPKATTVPIHTRRIVVLELPKSETDARAAVFMREDKSKEFDPQQRELLRRLAPHISRALSIRNRLQPSLPNDSDKKVDQETLQRLFRLAPSQAKLLALLVGGDQIKSAAAKLGVTEGSARQYLKKIFEKTGARRQMDLIRLADRALSQHES